MQGFWGNVERPSETESQSRHAPSFFRRPQRHLHIFATPDNTGRNHPADLAASHAKMPTA
ncbi:hypothetical protein [Neisseria zoodegmatis]|uniref:hypothetical protein n=1 Tax=Neisseria zoodegmatis TaxID=326523 RepID=UPI00117EDD28|nr:hypothetical protein [Neisseria zoodegmatis]